MIEIKAVRHADEMDQLIRLFTLIFKDNCTARIWEWKHMRHPLSVCMPETIVALDGSKVVGARPFMMNELWLGNKKVVAAQHCYSMVHPDYRRQGIFNRMGRYAAGYLAEHGCALCYGFPGPMSRRGFISQGYRRIIDIEIMFRLINPIGAIACKMNKRHICYASQDYQIEVWDKYTSELDGLDLLRRPGIIDMVRSEANLRWRFDNHPWQKYRYITAKKDGKLKGYVVISRQKQAGGYMAGLVVDYLVKDNNAACFEALVTKAVQEFTCSGCHITATWAFSDPELCWILINKFGFRSSGTTFFKRLVTPRYMDVLLVDENISADLDIYDSANWRITYAYPNFI